jgi:uncharacterized protein with PIN domain
MMDKDLSKIAKALRRLGFDVETEVNDVDRRVLVVESAAPEHWRSLAAQVRKPRER